MPNAQKLLDNSSSWRHRTNEYGSLSALVPSLPPLPESHPGECMEWGGGRRERVDESEHIIVVSIFFFFYYSSGSSSMDPLYFMHDYRNHVYVDPGERHTFFLNFL